jgi:hypothetical protein
MRSGIANLPLHGGKAPRWLFSRMVKLAEGIIEVFIEEFGQQKFLCRLSDPFWFQALGCVLGYDWHSSGVTTVTCGALKEVLDPEIHGLALAGGKGKVSRRAPEHIQRFSDVFNLSTSKINKLKYASKIAAKVDSVAVQDHHQLYHHVTLFDESGNWAVIQQGMNHESGYARRYHWLADNITSFIDTPHDAIVGEKCVDNALNMTAKESLNSRKISVDIVNDNPDKLRKYVVSSRPKYQETLDAWTVGVNLPNITLSMPTKINWTILRDAYEVQPRNFEELIALPGIGPTTVRALALIGELIYGTPPSWKDPVKYSFTVGGKDGVPYPVDRENMDRITEIIKQGVSEAKVGNREKLDAVQRLRRFVQDDIEN